jgi:hypothetical protein
MSTAARVPLPPAADRQAIEALVDSLGPPAPRMLLDKATLFEDLGYTPHAGQQRVHDSTALRRILACGVRWGKTRAAAMEGLAAAMEPRPAGSFGWIVAPTYDLADKVFRVVQTVALERLHHRIPKRGGMLASERCLRIRNLAGGLSEIRCRTAESPVSLLGEGLDWLIADEAARLRPLIWENHLSQRLIDRRGWALLISTPKGKGWFYDLWRRGQPGIGDPDFESWNAPSWANPYLPADLIERQRQSIPDRSFRQEYAAEFIEGSGAVFRNVREAARGEWEEPRQGMTYSAGLDLAKVEDYTVLTILDNTCRLVHADRFHKVDWSLQVKRIKATLERYGNPVLHVDSTGAGEPVYERLHQEDLNPRAYAFTARSKDALIQNLALLFEQGKIALPEARLWPEGIDELEGFQYTVTDLGNVKSGAPPGYHDDCVISLALAAWPFAIESRPSDWDAIKEELESEPWESKAPKYKSPDWTRRWPQ